MWYLYEIDRSLYELIYDWERRQRCLYVSIHGAFVLVSYFARCANVNSNAGAVFYFWRVYFSFHWEGGKYTQK